VQEDKGTRYYPETMDEKQRRWFDLFILRGMLGVLLRARVNLRAAPHPDALTNSGGNGRCDLEKPLS